MGINQRRIGGVAAAGAVLAAYGFLIERTWLEANRYEVALPRLAAAFDGYRITQISDIHSDASLFPDYLRRIAERANAEEPDLIALTGDFLSRGGRRYVRQLPLLLDRLRAKDGILAVTGNHDYDDVDRLLKCLESHGVTVIDNRVATLRRGGGSLHVCGVGDPLHQEDRLRRTVSELPPEGAAILLAHEPDYAYSPSLTGRFDLQLSGHSHGGQVRIPWLGAIKPVLPILGRRYVEGFYEVNGMRLFVSRGTGTVGIPMRLFCRPEIVTFTLRSP